MSRFQIEKRIDDLVQEIVNIDENRRKQTLIRERLVREIEGAKHELLLLENPTGQEH